MPDGTPLLVTAGVADVAEAEGAVEELVRANLITCQYADDGLRVGFAHALARAAVHQDLGPRERKDLHTRAARLTTGEAALLHRAAAAHGPDPSLSAELAERARELERRRERPPCREHVPQGTGARSAGPRRRRRPDGRREPLPDRRRRHVGEGGGGEARGAARRGHDASTCRPRSPGSVASRRRPRSSRPWPGPGPRSSTGAGAARWPRSWPSCTTCAATDARRADWAARALAEELPPDLVDSTAAARAMGLALIGRSREALAALGSLVADPTKVGRDGQHRLTARGALRAALDDLPGARRDLEAFVGATRGEVAPAATGGDGSAGRGGLPPG